MNQSRIDLTNFNKGKFSGNAKFFKINRMLSKSYLSKQAALRVFIIESKSFTA